MKQTAFILSIIGITLIFGVPITFYYLGTIGNVDFTSMAVPLVELGGFMLMLLISVIVVMEPNPISIVIGCTIMGGIMNMIIYVLYQNNAIVNAFIGGDITLNGLMLFIVVVFEITGVVLAGLESR